MSTRFQRVCENATPGDARKAAEIIAAALRASGNVVSIGPEYTVPYGHKAGLLAVDLSIEDQPIVISTPPPESVSADVQVSPATEVPSAETSSVAMATADGFDTPDPTIAEEYPSLITPGPINGHAVEEAVAERPVITAPLPPKNKGGRPRKETVVVVADGTRGMERGR